MNWIELLSLLALLLYAAASVGVVAGFLGRSGRIKHLALMLTAAGFCLHSLALVAEFFFSGGPAASRSAFLPLLAWSLVAVGLAMWWKLRLDILPLFSAPLAFALLFVSLAPPGVVTPLSPPLSGPVFTLHLGFVSIGLGLMAVAAGAAIIFLWQERSIKAKTPLAGFRKDLPALGSLDRINFLTTVIGFPAYSLGVLCGFIWARMTWGTVFSGDPKEWISLAVLACYAFLFQRRLAWGWRGRKPAIMALIIFAASLFSFLIVNTLLPTHHSLI